MKFPRLQWLQTQHLLSWFHLFEVAVVPLITDLRSLLMSWRMYGRHLWFHRWAVAGCRMWIWVWARFFHWIWVETRIVSRCILAVLRVDRLLHIRKCKLCFQLRFLFQWLWLLIVVFKVVLKLMRFFQLCPHPRWLFVSAHLKFSLW